MNRKVVYAETLGGPIPVKIVEYHKTRIKGVISRWVTVVVTKSVTDPYIEGYRFLLSWENIWLRHRDSGDGLYSFYEGKPEWGML